MVAPTFQEKINKSIQAGYSEDQIFEYIKKDPNYAGKVEASIKAGYKPKDILNFLAGSSAEAKVEQSARNDPIYQQYAPRELSNEELSKMSFAERKEYADELNRAREYLQSAGFTKSAISGATLGASEYVPGLKPQEHELNKGVGQLTGAVLPITGALKIGKWASKPLIELAKKSPVAGKQLGSLADLLGVGLTSGATYKGAEELIQGKLPSPANMLEEGALWAAIDTFLKGAGLTGRFVSSLLNKAKNTGKPSFTVLNDAVNQAKAEGIDISQADRVTTKVLSLLEAEAPAAVTESKALQNVKKLETDFDIPAGRRVSESLDSLGKHEPVDKIFGETVQKDIAASFKEAEAKYEPLYKKVEGQSQNIHYSDKSTIDLVQGMVKELNQVKTKAQNYDKVISTLKTVADDLGYSIESNADGSLKLLDSAGKEVTPETKIVYRKIPVSKGMELGRRLNQIVDYDIPERTIRDKLKPVTRSVKAGIRQALGSRSKSLEKIFDRAEKLYGDTAQKFGRDAVADIRHIQPTEKIIKIIDNPTSLDDLRKILSPKQFNQLERKIIEQYADKTPEQIQKARKQLEPYMSKEGKKAFKDLSETKGYESLQEKLTPVVKKDGTINFEALRELQKDPEFLRQVESLGGPEAVEFVRNLENYQRQIQKQIEQQANILSRVQVKPPSEAVRGQGKVRQIKQSNKGIIEKVDDWLDNIGINKESKTVLKAVLGIGGKIPLAAGNLGYKLFTNLIRNKANRTNYKRILAKTKPGTYKASEVKPLLTNLSLGLVKDENQNKTDNPKPKQKI